MKLGGAIHDSNLVAYRVDGSARTVVLVLDPPAGTVADRIEVEFHGVEAHCFPHPQLPAIVFGIEAVDAAVLVADEWSAISKGFTECAWCSPWAESRAGALAWARDSGCRGYLVTSSYGFSGWVLAAGVRSSVARAI